MALRLMLTRRQREFLREILVIILGVLIALAINEIADLVRWHYRVKETETRIADEMVRDQATLMAITEWQRCARVKLENLDAVLVEARASGRLPDIGVIDKPGFRAMTDAAWQTAVGNDVAAHMGDEDAERYARYFAAIGKINDGEWDFAQQWTLLDSLAHVPGSISTERIDTARAAIAELRLAIQASAFKIHQALSQLSPKLPSVPLSAPIRCRPLIVDLKPYVKRASDGL